jgi:hypothetical protein
LNICALSYNYRQLRKRTSCTSTPFNDKNESVLPEGILEDNKTILQEFNKVFPAGCCTSPHNLSFEVSSCSHDAYLCSPMNKMSLDCVDAMSRFNDSAELSLPLPKMSLDEEFAKAEFDDSDSAYGESLNSSNHTHLSDVLSLSLVSLPSSDIHCKASQQYSCSPSVGLPLVCSTPPNVPENMCCTPDTGIQVNWAELLSKVSPPNPDMLIGRKVGLETLDIVTELSFRDTSALSLVLSFLDDSDLCRCVLQNCLKIVLFNKKNY